MFSLFMELLLFFAVCLQELCVLLDHCGQIDRLDCVDLALIGLGADGGRHVRSADLLALDLDRVARGLDLLEDLGLRDGPLSGLLRRKALELDRVLLSYLDRDLLGTQLGLGLTGYILKHQKKKRHDDKNSARSSESDRYPGRDAPSSKIIIYMIIHIHTTQFAC